MSTHDICSADDNIRIALGGLCHPTVRSVGLGTHPFGEALQKEECRFTGCLVGVHELLKGSDTGFPVVRKGRIVL